MTQYARGFGSAAVSPYASGGGAASVIYSMGKSRDWMYSTVESIGQIGMGYNQYSTGGQSAISKFFSIFSIRY